MRVTRLKVAPNVVDPISLKENRPLPSVKNYFMNMFNLFLCVFWKSYSIEIMHVGKKTKVYIVIILYLT